MFEKGSNFIDFLAIQYIAFIIFDYRTNTTFWDHRLCYRFGTWGVRYYSSDLNCYLWKIIELELEIFFSRYLYIYSTFYGWKSLETTYNALSVGFTASHCIFFFPLSFHQLHYKSGLFLLLHSCLFIIIGKTFFYYPMDRIHQDLSILSRRHEVTFASNTL